MLSVQIFEKNSRLNGQRHRHISLPLSKYRNLTVMSAASEHLHTMEMGNTTVVNTVLMTIYSAFDDMCNCKAINTFIKAYRITYHLITS